MNLINNKSTIFIIFIIGILFHFLISLLFSQPFIFGDEVSYKTMAYSFYKYGDLYHIQSTQMGHTTEIPNFLYQLLISPSFYFGDFFLVIIKLINSITVSLIIFPLYFILKDFIDNDLYIFFSLVLILLIPDLNYSVSVMPESLFLLLFILTFYFSYKYFINNNIKFLLLSSLCASLLLLTKPHAIATIFSIMGVYFINILIALIKKDLNQIKIYIRDIFIFLLVISSIVYILSKIFANGFSLGFYSSVTTLLNNEFNLMSFSKNLIGHISTIMIIYGVPLLALIYSVFENFNFQENNEKKKKFYFSVLTLIILFIVLVMVIKFTNDISSSENYLRIHARYYFYLYPLLLISLFIFDLKMKKYKKVFLVLFSLIYLFNFYILFSNFSSQNGLITDNIQLVWILFLKASAFIYLFIFILTITNLFILFNERLRKKIYILLLLIYFIIINIFYILETKKLHHGEAVNYYNNIKNLEYFLGSDYNKKVTIFQNNGFDSLLRTVFWFPYNYNYTKIDSNLKQIDKYLIPLNTDYIVLFGNFDVKFDYESVKNYNNISIYDLKKKDYKEKINGIYQDSWTHNNFSMQSPEKEFKNLIINLNKFQPNLPCILNVITNDNKKYTYNVTSNDKELIIPFSESYTFELSKTFNPSKIGMSNDNRELGLFIESIYLEKDKK